MYYKLKYFIILVICNNFIIYIHFFTAFQSVPSFLQELKDERAVENETVVFECQFSGNPTPG